MKTLSVKATALLLAPMIALTSLTSAHAESIRTDDLWGMSLGHAYYTNSTVKSLIELADQSVQLESTDADREKALNEINVIVSNFSSAERIEMLDMIIEALPKIEDGPTVQSAKYAGIAMVTLVLAFVVLDTGTRSRNSKVQYATIAATLGLGLVTGFTSSLAWRRFVEVPKNIEALRLGLMDLRDATHYELKFKQLK